MQRHCWVLLASFALTIATAGCETDPDAVHASQIATPEDLSEVTSDVLNDPDRIRRMQRLSGLLEILPAGRFPELAMAVASRAIPPRQEDLGLLMHAWARVAPETALDQALDWKRSGVTWMEPTANHAVNEVIYVWAQTPSDDVDRAASQLPVALQTGASIAML